MMSEEQTTVAVQRYLERSPGTRLPSRSSGRSWIGPSAGFKCSAPISCTVVTRVSCSPR